MAALVSTSCAYDVTCRGYYCGKFPRALATSHVALASARTTPRVPPCAETGRHHRWSLKNRPLVARTFDDDAVISETAVEPQPTTIAALLERVPPAPAVDVDQQPQDAFEQTLWTLSAFACVVKQAEDDCDLHVEVAAQQADCWNGGRRVIVELPASYGKLEQEALLDAVGLAELGRKPKHFGNPLLAVHPPPVIPPPIVVTGWGFYDYQHRCETDPQHGCDHGSALVATLAELHPAIVRRP